jgi:hypothetical protein
MSLQGCLREKTLPILKEALGELTLKLCPLTTRVFAVNITAEFILGLTCTYDVPVDLECCVLQAGK